MKKVAVLGMGNFGFAILRQLDRVNETKISDEEKIILWGYDKDVEDVEYLNENKFPRGIEEVGQVSEKVKFSADLAKLCTESDIIVMAIASAALKKVASLMLPYLNHGLTVVSIIKGFSLDGKSALEVMNEAWSNAMIKPKIAVLAGGTTAKELALGSGVLAMTLGADNLISATELAELWEADNLRIQTSTDVRGIEYASGLKNVISILVGMVEEMTNSFGTATYTLAQLSRECEDLAIANGAQKDTFSLGSQCWGNDMVMSALGQTRNRKFGQELARRGSYEVVINDFAERGETVEGTKTVAALKNLTDNLGQYPLLNFIYRLSKNETTTTELLEILRKIN